MRRRATEGDEAELGELLDNEGEGRHGEERREVERADGLANTALCQKYLL